MTRLMARKPEPGDVLMVSDVLYRIGVSQLPKSIGSVYAERPCGCEWVEVELTKLRWNRLRGIWRVDRSAVFMAGGR